MDSWKRALQSSVGLIGIAAKHFFTCDKGRPACSASTSMCLPLCAYVTAGWMQNVNRSRIKGKRYKTDDEDREINKTFVNPNLECRKPLTFSKFWTNSQSDISRKFSTDFDVIFRIFWPERNQKDTSNNCWKRLYEVILLRPWIPMSAVYYGRRSVFLKPVIAMGYSI